MKNDDIPEHVLLRPGVDRLLENLSRRRRRLILLALTHESVTNKRDLLFRGEDDAKETELVHTHLPRLEDAGYIEWDRDTGEIRKGPRYDEIAPLLALIDNHADELPPDWP